MQSYENVTVKIANDIKGPVEYYGRIKGVMENHKGPREGVHLWCRDVSMRLCDLYEISEKIDEVQLDFSVASNHLKDFNNFPSHIGKLLTISNCEYTSLCGIHNHIKRCSKIDMFGMRILEGGIGLIFIEDLVSVECNGGHPLKDALKIIEKYYGTGKDGLLECQSKLIDAGLEEFALL